MVERNRVKSERYGTSERGSAMLEGLLCIPILVIIVAASIDLGRLVFAHNFVSYSAREATRYALAHGTTYPVTAADITAFVKKRATGLDPNSITVTSTWSSPSHTPGTNVQVNVQCTFQPLSSFISLGSVMLSSTSTMLISQ